MENDKHHDIYLHINDKEESQSTNLTLTKQYFCLLNALIDTIGYHILLIIKNIEHEISM